MSLVVFSEHASPSLVGLPLESFKRKIVFRLEAAKESELLGEFTQAHKLIGQGDGLYYTPNQEPGGLRFVGFRLVEEEMLDLRQLILKGETVYDGR